MPRRNVVAAGAEHNSSTGNDGRQIFGWAMAGPEGVELLGAAKRGRREEGKEGKGGKNRKKKEFVAWTYAEDPPPPPEPEKGNYPDEFAGQPDWWRKAVLLERENKLEEAEQLMMKAVDHIGIYSSIAHMYEMRVGRLRSAGEEDLANEAGERAIHWLRVYAGSATSGGEGAALSRERDERIRSLGGTP